jgi:hypothetical protein
MTVEQRLEQLEKRSKRLTVALTMMAMAAITIQLSACGNEFEAQDDDEECPFIYTAADCETEALAKGLRIGGEGYDFEGDYGTKGCYAYDSGTYEGIAFFGTGGDPADMEAEAQTAKGKYRVTGPC